MQVGYSNTRDDSAPDALKRAGLASDLRLFDLQRVHERSAGTMFLVYTKTL